MRMEKKETEKQNVAMKLFKLRRPISNTIRTIYANISYPLTNPAIIKVTTNENITYAVLLYMYTKAYQYVYKMEEKVVGDPGSIPGMLNRAKSDGQFGIWGHDIEDLVYNGFSEVEVYKNHIVCDFNCDS